ncbi:MAG: tyrosine-type recombinase/integrase [Deltaproteobacteria bacterium]|nr:tyrosine-type recombinase/integrase [Deltaproteobacteria bacterium]
MIRRGGGGPKVVGAVGCYRRAGATLTLGLATPRRKRALPLVLSKEEVVRLLEAAPALRDKLLLALMYATGMRVSEVVRLRFWDLDFDRSALSIRQAKGRRDRQVMLPASLQPLLRRLAAERPADGLLFPAAVSGRHISTRVAQRVMARAVQIAGIGKPATPHSLRHAFATHLLEAGTDVRFIQELLGHLNLETTRLYAHVASSAVERIESPIDRLLAVRDARARLTGGAPASRPVGRMRLELRAVGPTSAEATLVIWTGAAPVRLAGVVVKESRPGFYSIDLPPLEAWAAPMQRLSPAERVRLQEPEFYERLREVVVGRFRALRAGAVFEHGRGSLRELPGRTRT